MEPSQDGHGSRTASLIQAEVAVDTQMASFPVYMEVLPRKGGGQPFYQPGMNLIADFFPQGLRNAPES